jgi:hypothetical protein
MRIRTGCKINCRTREQTRFFELKLHGSASSVYIPEPVILPKSGNDRVTKSLGEGMLEGNKIWVLVQ